MKTKDFADRFAHKNSVRSVLEGLTTNSFFQVGAVSNGAVEDQIYSIVQSSEDGLDTDTISALTAAIPVLDRQVLI